MENSENTEAWRQEIISALKVFHYYLANSDGDLMLGILQPGGGQYYCLSILDEKNVLLYMNRGASATSFSPQHFALPDFAKKALRAPEKVAATLFEGSNMTYSYGSITPVKASKLRMIAHMIGLLEELEGQVVDLEWGYFDSSDAGAESKFETLPQEYPKSWGDVAPVKADVYGWAANILRVTADGQVAATYNQQTAEVLLVTGRLISF
jgi:hypothetical protein